MDKISPIKLYDENRFIGGIMLRHLLFKQGQHEYMRHIIEKVIKLFTMGKIRPHIDSTWAYEDVSLKFIISFTWHRLKICLKLTAF